MRSNYWKYTGIIAGSLKEKENLLKYEVDMFRESCKQLMSGSVFPFKQNLLIESLAIHTRILVDFFYSSKKNKNDVIAQDFLPKGKDWGKVRPSLTKTLEDAKEKANKQLAHLNLWRLKLLRDGRKGWDSSKIKTDMEKLIEKFEEIKDN